METVEEIQHLLERLSLGDRLGIARWLQEFDHLQSGEGRAEEARVAYASEPPFMTLEEFLVFEEKSPTGHEYLEGAVFAMAGPSVAHERIRHNLVMALGNYLGRGPCQVFSSSMQLRIRHGVNEICYYPDIMVDCQRESWGANFVLNPKLVVEVLSPSTHLIDRREKLQNYRLVSSVEEYVVVAQDEHKLTIYPRAGGWRPRVHAGLEAVAEFRSVELSVPLIEIYSDVLDLRRGSRT
jgi:Uma2 family endonuclease